MSAPVEHARQFTVASANRTLPLVRMIVADIVELYRDVRERRDRLEALNRSRRPTPQREADPYREEVEEVERQLEQDEQRIQSYVNELHDLGVELKDPVEGLVDFPTTIDGQAAYLCWKLGEVEVGYWHSLDSGFAGRQPLPVRPADHAV
uniref:DUF2203 family protein n=1 Tax=Schlesneria paludicola TaxID=360056 RepID=A0A7C4LPL5_9PLAN